MCGRYSLFAIKASERMRQLIEICNAAAQESEKINISDSGDVFPNEFAPGLIFKDGSIHAVSMKWGFEKNSKLIINARTENIRERVMFRHLLHGNRCALPAYGYYEWRDGDHQKHMILPENEDSMYLAGVYMSDSHGTPRFVIMTRVAHGRHASIHSRMPIVLHSRQQAREWICGAIEPEALITDPDDSLVILPVGNEQLQMELFDQFDIDS